MLISRRTVFLSLLTITTLLGCGHVTEYRYLDEVSSRGSQDIYVYNDNRNKLTRGRELDRVWVDPDFNIGKYRKIYIKPVQIDPGLMDEEQSSQLASYFTESLRDEIKHRLLLRVIESKEGPLPEKTLVLETGLTQLDRSDKVKKLRALPIVINPLDQTYVQVEGRLKDANTNETLFLFADNRAGSALFSGDAEAWQEHIANIAKDLILEMAAIKVKLVP